MNAQKEQAAADKIREFLRDLYGEEEMLIVRNATNGIVSIGFGELGDKGGKAIPRSKLPIVLTDEFPRDTWIKSSDFRRAVAKGWLVPVSRAEYETEMRQYRQTLENLSTLTKKDTVPVMPSRDPENETKVIDEETAQLKPASEDKRIQQFMEYESAFEETVRPAPTTPPGVDVIGTSISSRVISFCEEMKRGSMTNMQAITWLYDEEKILTENDLAYVKDNAVFESVQVLAQKMLGSRRGA